MKYTFICLLLTINIIASAQTDSAYYFFRSAKAAYKEQKADSYYDQITKALRYHPYHPAMLYEAAIASAMTNRNDQSLEYLKSAFMINAKADLEKPEFKTLPADKLESLKEKQKQTLVPIINSDTLLVINDPTLHIECITPGFKPNTYYCGSIHKRKIIEVDSKGKINDFAPSGSDGMTSVFGLKVDRKNKLLWACSSPMPEMENFDSTARSAIFKYDVLSKKLIAKYAPTDSLEHIFGDLTLHPDGSVFVSDSRQNIVYRVNSKAGTLDEFCKSKDFWNLQGITFDASGKNLFIADYIKGIFKLNLESKKLTQLAQNFDISLKSIDGLTSYGNSLIAIQNFIYPMRVTQYFLDDKAETLTDYKIIDRGHPAFNEPTIGFADGSTNAFIYVANSLWSGYDDNRKLKPIDQLQPVVILRGNPMLRIRSY